MNATTVSEDLYNRNQSWNYAGVYRIPDGLLRVEVRANAYEEQSYAKVSVWSDAGWAFHTSLPTLLWPNTPSYTKKELEQEDVETFRMIRDDLLARYAAAMWGYRDVELDGQPLNWAVA